VPGVVPGALAVVPVHGVPELAAGDDLAALLVAACRAQGTPLGAGDVVVVSSKAVSKSRGLVTPVGADRDAVVLEQSVRVVAERATARPDGGADDSPPRPSEVTRVVQSVAGPVMAAAGVDASNAGPGGALLLLPAEPDAEAARLRAALRTAGGLPTGAPLGVVLADTAGRPWRLGLTDFALGAAGVAAVVDHRGESDHDGRPLTVTARAVVDELAGAADLVKGKSDGIPAALVRGVPPRWLEDDAAGAGAGSLVRTGAGDWFALGHLEAVRAALGVPPGSAAAAEVGLPPVGPSPLPERVRRAVALTLHHDDDASADVEVDAFEARVSLGAADAFALGRLAARLEVAAASEDVTAETGRPTAEGTVLVVLRPAAPDRQR
jgi:coenzyme F420-0:L-glutamate ligase/coenzyme F420-1:gamma-L-glutamate ligase